MYFPSIVFLIACLGRGAPSLSCYTCNDCEGGFNFNTNTGKTEECGFGYDQCFKEIEDDGDVNRGCQNSLVCTAKEGTVGKCVNEDVRPCYLCCNDADNCNSANVRTVSLAAMFASLGAFLLFHLLE